MSFFVYPTADIAGRFIGRTSGEFARIRTYLHQMLFPALGYMLGYLVLTIVFGGLFQLAYYSRFCSVPCIVPASPGTALDPSDFFYFPITILTTFGYGQSFATPVAPLAKGIVSLELICGAFWSLIICAALVGFLGSTITTSNASGQVAPMLKEASLMKIRQLIQEAVGTRKHVTQVAASQPSTQARMEVSAGSITLRLELNRHAREHSPKRP